MCGGRLFQTGSPVERKNQIANVCEASRSVIAIVNADDEKTIAFIEPLD
jgi:hypothetical protein